MLMSYIKPKLIETKIIKKITNKLEEKKNKIILENNLKEQEILQNEIINKKPESFYKEMFNNLLEFIKNNYVIIIIISLIIILLYVRHLETIKRKKKLKEILNDID